MKSSHDSSIKTSYSAPTAINIVITFAAFSVYLIALWVASHGETFLMKALAVLAFALCSNTLFSLLHEAVHGNFSGSRVTNEIFGQVVAMTFPTGLRFQRTCHFGHHLNNRTDHEIFEMYYPNDNLFLKNIQLYSILTGPYWLSVSLGWLLYLFFPWFYRLADTKFAKQSKFTDAAMFKPFIKHPARHRIRFELILTIAFQVFIYHWLKLSFWPTFACFWTFGLIWGSLQYADHAYTKRDIRNGAWNLKVNPVVRMIFLNYHHHQVHHLNPQIPWLHLGKHIDESAEQPSFLKIYFRMWRGLVPVESKAPEAVEESFKQDYLVDH